MTKMGIIGHAADKFTSRTEFKARELITVLLKPWDTLVSGHSPKGGIDIWAEEYADIIGAEKDIKTPRQLSWSGEYGYKARNYDIAKCSDELHVILVQDYPPGYKGLRFTHCYHCHTDAHVKSGACWTAKQALKLGKKVVWHIID